MFVKRSFGVKYPARISFRPGERAGERVTPSAGSMSHPPKRLHPMSTPLLRTPDPALVFRPVAPRPDGRLDAGVYRRRRLVVVAVVLGLVLGVVLFGRQAGANRPAEQLAAEAVTVTVQPGDTLWTIARSLAPDDDPRPLTDALVDLAGGTSLQPGQRIVIPGSLLD